MHPCGLLASVNAVCKADLAIYSQLLVVSGQHETLAGETLANLVIIHQFAKVFLSKY